MNLTFDIFAVLCFVGLALALFWAITLLSIKKGNRAANKFLAILLFMVSIGIVKSILFHSNFIFEVPHLLGLALPINFLYPPLFYLYVKTLISGKINLKKHLFHFVPFLICVVYIIPFIIQSADYKISYFSKITNKPSTTLSTVLVLITLQEIAYLTFSLILLVKHSKRVKNVYSSLSRYNFYWIRNLITSYLIVTVLFIYLNAYDFPLKSIHIGPIVVVVMIYTLGYMGLKQPAVFTEVENGTVSKKYQKSSLTSEKGALYLQRLSALMENEKPFTNSNLTLPQLAGKLSISQHHLSQLLNDRLNQTFFEFINYCRVEEAKKCLKDPQKQHLKILAIAYEVGFNSKSNFNSAFKRFVHQTPTQYKNRR